MNVFYLAWKFIIHQRIQKMSNFKQCNNFKTIYHDINYTLNGEKFNQIYIYFYENFQLEFFYNSTKLDFSNVMIMGLDKHEVVY